MLDSVFQYVRGCMSVWLYVWILYVYGVYMFEGAKCGCLFNCASVGCIVEVCIVCRPICEHD